MEIGAKITNFHLNGTSNLNAHLNDYKGQYVILYFYPKDATPGCTTQGVDFRDAYKKFQALDTDIFGISRDTLKSHESFKAKFTFPFELLSDEEEKACELFGVIKMKNMYGKQVRGIERSTFIIDPNGKLIQAWRGVKVEGHIKEVLQFIKQYNSI